MDLRYNSGRGAVLCSKCRIIVDQDFDSLTHFTYVALSAQNIDWFCRDCDSEAAFSQLEVFATEYGLQEAARIPAKKPKMLTNDTKDAPVV